MPQFTLQTHDSVYRVPLAHGGNTVAEATGPLNQLRGRNSLLLADIENWRFSALNKLGAAVSCRLIAQKISRVCRAAEFHAVFSRNADQQAWDRYFTERGWVPHARPIFSFSGGKRESNADPRLLFTAGQLLATRRPDVLIIGSGDGLLVEELARAIHEELLDPPEIMTLSLAGSTHHRLDARHNPRIAENIELGRDCLRWK